jgi:hypothetical protein
MQPFGSRGAFRKPLVNHLGYRPHSAKYLVLEDLPGAREAHVVRMHKKGFNASLTVPLRQAGDDFGNWLVGDFSALTEPGTYRTSVPFQFFAGNRDATDAWSNGILEAWSYDFVIGEKVWDATLRKMVDYYQVQRCGGSPRGYNAPCHTGPIPRDDGGPAKPMPGGWHSAHDHVRDLPEILHGMFGLLAVARVRPDLDDELNLFDELRWGNDYFLSLQDPRGYVYFGVYTKDYFSACDWWDTACYVLRTEPGPRYCQYMFVSAQAALARLYRERQPEYAARCLDAAGRCFAYWASRPGSDWGAEKNLYELGAGAYAAALMFQATASEMYRAAARHFAAGLLQLQDADGFWPEQRNQDADPNPDYNLLNARALYPAFAPIGLCEVLRVFPGDTAAPRWKEALVRFTGFAGSFASANGFGILPHLVYRDPATPRTRRGRDLSYRYFLDPHTVMRCPGTKPIPWQTGNHGIVAGYGVALFEIGKLLDRSEPHQLAQRQLDWILGVNPLDTCHVLGFGRNNPVTYPSLDFMPPVPDIPGAGMQGMVGDDADHPMVIGGYYSTGEFWMPQHSWTLWLLAELSADQSGKP